MRRLALALLVGILAACSDAPVQPPEVEVSDGAPLRSIKPSEVPEIIEKAEEMGAEAAKLAE